MKVSYSDKSTHKRNAYYFIAVFLRLLLIEMFNVCMLR